MALLLNLLEKISIFFLLRLVLKQQLLRHFITIISKLLENMLLFHDEIVDIS